MVRPVCFTAQDFLKRGYIVRYHEVNELAIREALASTRMEGLTVTSEIEQNVRRILNGEITVEQRIREIRGKHYKKQV